MSTESLANHAIKDEVYRGIDDEKSVANLKLIKGWLQCHKSSTYFKILQTNFKRSNSEIRICFGHKYIPDPEIFPNEVNSKWYWGDWSKSTYFLASQIHTHWYKSYKRNGEAFKGKQIKTMAPLGLEKRSIFRERFLNLLVVDWIFDCQRTKIPFANLFYFAFLYDW